MSDEKDLRQLIRYDWIYGGRYACLHAPASGIYDVPEWRMRDITTACGRRMKRAFIPGVCSRMGLRRCDKCCDALGYPRGIGSPKNDDACRKILGLLKRKAHP